MRRLHPAAWLGVGLSLGAVPVATSNWLVDLIVLGALVVLSVNRAGSRDAAFVWSMVAGLLVLVVHLVLGAFVSGVPPDPTVLTFLPERALGDGVSIGGPYSTEQLTVSIERGLDAWVLCGVIGFWWQVCPAGQWCDLTRVVVGRGSQMLAPALCLGESLASVQGQPLRGRLGAVVEANRQICESWRIHSRPGRPDPRHALVSALLLTVTTGVVFSTSALGGLRVRASDDRVDIIDAKVLCLGLAVVWVVARLIVSRERLAPVLRWADAAALSGAGVLTAGVLFSDRTIDAVPVVTPPGAWPQVPVVICACVAGALLLWVALQRSRTGDQR